MREDLAWYSICEQDLRQDLVDYKLNMKQKGNAAAVKANVIFEWDHKSPDQTRVQIPRENGYILYSILIGSDLVQSIDALSTVSILDTTF